MPAEPPPIAAVPTAVTAFVGAARRGPVNRAVPIDSLADFEQRFGGLSATVETGYAVRQYFLNGGSAAWMVRVAKKLIPQQIERGLRALDAVDLFNLLLLPGLTSPAAFALAASYCQTRRAVFIADATATAKTAPEVAVAVQDLAAGPRSCAAIYHPWITIADPLNGDRPRLCAPSGTIAGLVARTDASRGVWKSPAGVDATLEGVTGLALSLSDADSARLNPRGINALRAFPNRGFVAWGARTLAGDDTFASEFKYLAVRRTALFIEESVRRGTAWAVFEPNDEPLWAALRLNVGAFLQTLFRQGAFAGRTPPDAYFVKCDREAMTAADLTAGTVSIVVGFAPLKPAEFVLIDIRQFAGR